METIFTLSPWVVAVVPLVLALVEMVKRMGLPNKYAPLASIGFGVLLTLLVPEVTVWQELVVQGLLAGLVASGLYSGTRATLK